MHEIKGTDPKDCSGFPQPKAFLLHSPPPFTNSRQQGQTAAQIRPGHSNMTTVTSDSLPCLCFTQETPDSWTCICYCHKLREPYIYNLKLPKNNQLILKLKQFICFHGCYRQACYTDDSDDSVIQTTFDDLQYYSYFYSMQHILCTEYTDIFCMHRIPGWPTTTFLFN